MNKNTITLIIALIAIVLAVMNIISIGQLNSSLETFESPEVEQEMAQTEESDYEVAKAMGYMQRYSHKLYWAGMNENWTLSKFYAHELEETIEEIEDAKVIDEGFAVSAMVAKMTNPAFEEVEKAIEIKDKAAFDSSYQLLMQSCNACHAASKHEFIVIETPTEGKAFNQKFD